MIRLVVMFCGVLITQPLYAQTDKQSELASVLWLGSGILLLLLLVLVIRFLTPPKESATDEQSRRLEAFEKSADGQMLYELTSDSAGETDFALVDANPACFDIFRNAGFDLINSTLRQHVRYLRCQEVFSAALDAVETGRRQRCTIEVENDVIDPEWLDILIVRNQQGIMLTVRDVSARYQQAAELAKSNHMLTTLLEKIQGHFVYIRSAEGDWLYIGESVASVLGCDARHFKSEHASLLLKQTPEQQEVLTMWRNGESIVMYQADYLSDGRGQIQLEHYESPVVDADGSLVAVYGIARDVSSQQHLQNEMAYQANHDPLTGAMNRYALDKQLAELLVQLDDSGGLTFSYLDLDGFAQVNFEFGQVEGDNLLKGVANLISRHLHRNETLCRIGGDEFAILAQGAGIQRAEQLAQSLIDAIESFKHNGQEVKLGANIGIVEVNADIRQPSELIERADLACKQSKLLGSNRFFVDL